MFTILKTVLKDFEIVFGHFAATSRAKA